MPRSIVHPPRPPTGALFAALAALSALGCGVTGTACSREAGGAAGVQALRVQVVKSYPHDPDAFTQGLEWYRGRLFESTGLNGKSSVRRVVLETGTVEAKGDLPTDIFGEGLTRVGDNLIQLSWRSGRAIVWDLATLRPTAEFTYQGEGWGLCYDGERLVMSDGSDRLTLRDPATFAPIGELLVRKDGQPVANLNELECVGHDIYANIWQDDHLVRIDGKTGAVTAFIDAAGLLTPSERQGTDVLNGIAHHKETGTFLLTGKNWPKLFEVKWIPASP